MKKYKKKKIIFSIILLAILLAILLITIVCFLIKGFKSKDPYFTFESRIEETSKYTIADATTVGWLQVQGTDIDYPVIRETLSAYQSGLDYLWTPNIYIDGQNRMTIYGHNILNVSSHPLIREKTHTRFEQLMGFVYDDFAKKNLYIQYTHDGVDDIYKIYAINFIYSSDDNGMGYTKKDAISTYINYTKKNSIYDYDVDVNSNDQLISLITCTRFFGITGKREFRIDARKLRKGENINYYLVETNQNYDIIKETREAE